MARGARTLKKDIDGNRRRSRKRVQRGGAPPTTISSVTECTRGTTGCSSTGATYNETTSFTIKVSGGVISGVGPATSWSAVLNGTTITSTVSSNAYIVASWQNPLYTITFRNLLPNTSYTVTQLTAFNGTESTSYSCNITTVTMPTKPSATATINSDGSILIRITTPDTNPLFSYFVSELSQANFHSIPWITTLSPVPVAATDGGGGYTTTIPSTSFLPGSIRNLYIAAYNTTPSLMRQSTSVFLDGSAKVVLAIPPTKPVITQGTCGWNNTTVTWPWTGPGTTYTWAVAETSEVPTFTAGSSTTVPNTLVFNSGLTPGSSPVITVTATATVITDFVVNRLTTVSDPFTAITLPALVHVTVTDVTSSSITISWTGVEGLRYIPRYWVFLGSSVITGQLGPEVTVETITGVGTLSYTFTLRYGSQFYVAVNAINACGDSGNSRHNMTIAANVPRSIIEPPPNVIRLLPIAPSITFQIITQTESSCSVRFYPTSRDVFWPEPVASYTFNGGASIPYPMISPLPATTLALIPGENNTFVGSLTNVGGTRTITRSFPTPPLTPTALSVVANSVSGTGFSVSWAAVNGSATTYEFFMGGGAVTPSSIGRNSATFTGLTANSTYSVTLSATANGTTSALSTALSVVTGPEAPVISGFSSLTETGFTVNWTGATGATSYSYVVNGVSATPVSSTTRSATFGGYSAGEYSVSVIAVNSAGRTPSVESSLRLVTAAQLQASSSVQQTASSAEEQVASSAQQQAASSAQQQSASSAQQQSASSAQQQVASSARQQQASSSAVAQAVSAAQQSSAVAQADSSAQQQAASSSLPERESSARQQAASSAQQQIALGNVETTKDGMKRSLQDLQKDIVINIDAVYRPGSSTVSGNTLATLQSKLLTLEQSKSSLLRSAIPIFQLSPTYQDSGLQTVLQNTAAVPQGQKRVFDTLRNAYIYLDANSQIIAAPPIPYFAASIPRPR